MPGCFPGIRRCAAAAVLFGLFLPTSGAQDGHLGASALPNAETLYYGVEWRFINAGAATLHFSGGRDTRMQASVHIESAGLVSKLYRLNDDYTVHLDEGFCAVNSDLNALEGKKHRYTTIRIDRAREKATYTEQDLVKNKTVSKELQVPSCVADAIGGLMKLRTMHLEPGQSVQIPTTDGKKWANVKIEAQERENITTSLGTFKTVRYEAYLFNGVIYKRNARIFVWLTDDERRVPVQIRARMSFPIGNITLQLQKQERS